MGIMISGNRKKQETGSQQKKHENHEAGKSKKKSYHEVKHEKSRTTQPVSPGKNATGEKTSVDRKNETGKSKKKSYHEVKQGKKQDNITRVASNYIWLTPTLHLLNK